MHHRASLRAAIALLLILLTACGQGPTPPPPTEVEGITVRDPVVHDNVRVLSEAAQATLRTFTLDLATGQGELRFAAGDPSVAALEPGHVLVSEPVPGAAPHGLLQLVESSRVEGNELVLSTKQANLLDVFEDAGILFEHALTEGDLAKAALLYDGMSISSTTEELSPQASGSVSYGFTVEFDKVLIDIDDDPSTTNDQLRLDGAFRFNATASAGIDICAVCGDWFTPAVRKVYGKARLEESIDVRISGELATRFNESIPVANLDFGTFTIWVGPVPVVFVIDLVVSVGADGKFEASLEATATQSTVVQVGVQYTRSGGWRDLNEFDSNFDFPTPNITAAAAARAYLRPQLNVEIYGLAGPYLYAEAYVGADAELFRQPFWRLKAGIDFGIGFKIDLPIVGNVAKYDAKLVGFDRTLAESPNRAPQLTITSPTDGTRQPTARDVSVLVTATDLEQRELLVTLTDDRGLPTRSVTANGAAPYEGRVSFPLGCLEPAAYTFTAATKDAGGLEARATTTLVVENVVPTLEVGDPAASGVVITPGYYFPISASAFDRTCAERENAADQTAIRWQVNGAPISSGRELYYRVPDGYARPTLNVRASYLDDDGGRADIDSQLDVTAPPPGWTAAPSAAIALPLYAPNGGPIVLSSDDLVLQGMAYHPRTGPLDGASYVWEAKRSEDDDSTYGQIATGKDATVTAGDALRGGLGLTNFTIRLTITHGGQSATATVDVRLSVVH